MLLSVLDDFGRVSNTYGDNFIVEISRRRSSELIALESITLIPDAI